MSTISSVRPACGVCEGMAQPARSNLDQSSLARSGVARRSTVWLIIWSVAYLMWMIILAAIALHVIG